MDYEQHSNVSYLQSRVTELELEVRELKAELTALKALETASKREPGKLFLDTLVGEDWDDPDEKTDISDQLSGRIVYVLNKTDELGIGFHCGPETKDGWLEDTNDCGLYSQLEELLGCFIKKERSRGVKLSLDVGAADNYHTISILSGDDPNKVWKRVEEVLVEAGAVKWQRPKTKI